MKTFSTNTKSDVILHAFDWPYADIAANAETISSMGYKNSPCITTNEISEA